MILGNLTICFPAFFVVQILVGSRLLSHEGPASSRSTRSASSRPSALHFIPHWAQTRAEGVSCHSCH
jgi:hypothetical protein